MESPDTIVVGSGIAGLTFALKAASFGRVQILTKKHRAESNTNYAQGGIAAGLGPDDDPELHLADTLAAGAGLCRPDRVRLLVEEGPERVRELVEWGARFQLDPDGDFSLGREGGHSRRRIVRAADRTGREVERALLDAVERHPRIRVSQDLLVLDLLLDPDGRATGVQVLDVEEGTVSRVPARVVFLATGGGGQLWSRTTNPAIATADGIAMAWRGGARVANLEFVQFHPTALHPVEDPAFLLSEALRGEGAVLRRRDGSPFMDDHDDRGSLAPRDVVALAIHRELRATGDSHVVLDVSSIPETTLFLRFPGTMEGCRRRFIDPVREGIPVTPAAHYLCGGVLVDEDGRTSVPGLLAAGEVTCTGVHGANRLASNSLLEALVFSHRAAEILPDELDSAPTPSPERMEAAHREWEGTGRGRIPRAADRVVDPRALARTRRLQEIREGIRKLMWDDVGIVRTAAGLARAVAALPGLRDEVEALLDEDGPSGLGVELANLSLVAELVARSAAARGESRGLHQLEGQPVSAPVPRETVLDPRDATTVHQPELGRADISRKGSAPA
ncbi:MAG: L-aspartate oxidase [Gemmatimonadales bacterium]|nr:MAG: L-aspartate oxidase [Gemmatimonadales bacterium]